ncbi:MAG TPA: ABC transporter substrate-binding protein [Cyclobacteriaceae bacterium]|jgi:iron complex transport system substrate-binding protein|nr:ABC transporter substrate-binding protein [Cyclobacteriaceae bacterium]
MKNSKLIWLIVSYLLLVSCAKKETTKSDKNILSVKYASGFAIQELADGNKLVEVGYPYQGAKSGYKYLLVQRGNEIPKHESDVEVISIPIQSIVCTSTTHIPLLDYLNETDKLIGFPTTDYISSEKMRKRVDEGKVKDLGIDKGMNIEELFLLKPSIVMGYAMRSDLGQLKKIKELGVPVVINAEYLEKHPLGRAEWIKFMALFFNKEKMADSVFQFIEKEYLTAQALAKTTSSKPTVMSGIVYGDVWFMPGGKNYAATLLNDAGCNYLWNDTESNGWLEIGFESVFAKAKDADLWIGVGTYKSLKEIEAAEKRYALFKPFREKNVYSYTARQGAKGGSEFLELGYLRPDLILKDLVKIAHPELLPEYQLYFHRRLD